MTFEASHKTDFADVAVTRFIEYFQDQDNIDALCRSYVNRVQELEDSIWEVINERAMNFPPVGEQLTVIGKLVGIPIRTVQDDDEFRTIVTVQIGLNKSHALVDVDIKTIATLVFADGATWQYHEEWPHQYRIALQQVPATNVSRLAQTLHRVGAAGVASRLSFRTATPGFPLTLRMVGGDSYGGDGLGDAVNAGGTPLMGVVDGTLGVVKQTKLETLILDVNELTIEDGAILDLPSWFEYSDSPSQVDAGSHRIGPNQAAPKKNWKDIPRAWSDDGVTFGLLIEHETENLVTEHDPRTGAWTENGTVPVTVVTGPDGNDAYLLEVDDSGAAEFRVLNNHFAIGLSTHVLSLWVKDLDDTGSRDVSKTREAGVADMATVTSDAVDDDWEHSSAVYTGAATISQAEFYLQPGGSGSAGVGRTQYALWQVEAGAYETSFIDGTRYANRCAIDVAKVIPWGYFEEITMVFRPRYASGGLNGNNHILFRLGPTAYFDMHNVGLVRMLIDGVTSQQPVTWSKYDRLTVTFKWAHDEAYIIVNGVKTTFTPGAPISAYTSQVYPFTHSAPGADESAIFEYLKIVPGLNHD